jgi:hypothetical protein
LIDANWVANHPKESYCFHNGNGSHNRALKWRICVFFLSFARLNRSVKAVQIDGWFQMKKTLSNLVISGTLLLATSAPLLAQAAYGLSRPRPVRGRVVHSVPEIDASAGLLAIAAVLAITAFAWERRRRSA